MQPVKQLLRHRNIRYPLAVLAFFIMLAAGTKESCFAADDAPNNESGVTSDNSTASPEDAVHVQNPNTETPPVPSEPAPQQDAPVAPPSENVGSSSDSSTAPPETTNIPGDQGTSGDNSTQPENL